MRTCVECDNFHPPELRSGPYGICTVNLPPWVLEKRDEFGDSILSDGLPWINQNDEMATICALFEHREDKEDEAD